MAVFAKDALKHRHILITGATGGIGWKTAKVLAGMGAKLTITGRNTEKLNQLKVELYEITNATNLCAVAADLSSEEDRKKLIETAEEKLGFISGLVNVAGISGGSTVDQLDVEDVKKMMEVNYFATFSLTQAIYQKMIEQGKGSIVNVSSLSGLRGTHGNSAYAASKFAMIGWTQSMAVEAIQHKVRVNAVCPGYVNTEMARNGFEKKAERHHISFEEAKQNSLDTIPSGRLTEPVEVANSIAFLLTDAAKNIVGESLKISGGNVMR
ncbi:3-oxoacyl-[acyl-carrier protein] reductase [Gracilibacillus ureilyticus]|uniref:3-oxoacyl-[acyl-carrier protein] reductase n=1 Tax=Gracilibacillus ureilyticus TaxID=531814 RepID=A0A1H9M7S5_9BACI|nr:SDR family oxidoreductase [Gracilibacillus ureilyticus]SER19800.1 3-oxoacyl-[acyl-carrier protein] reductase [Gracilibacillus ureilyticus]